MYGPCLNALDEVRYGIIFDYFMRVESGKGDTVDLLVCMSPVGYVLYAVSSDLISWCYGV